jgi:hypothetical protein
MSECEKGIKQTGFKGVYYRLSISGNTEIIPCKVKRRIAGERKHNKNVLRFGFAVIPCGIGEYFGFELLESDRRFLLGDFTVTHNTVCFSYIAHSAGLKGSKVLI